MVTFRKQAGERMLPRQAKRRGREGGESNLQLWEHTQLLGPCFPGDGGECRFVFRTYSAFYPE